MTTGPGRGFARSPSLPVAVLLGVTPALATAQFRAMALAVTIGFALAIAAHWRHHRRLPWPRATAPVLLAGALLGWALIATLWSAEARHGLGTALGLAGLLVLAAMTARALADDDAAHVARIGRVLLPGLALGVVLLAFDHASGNMFRLAVRGFPEWTERIGFGLKPAVSVLALMLPLVLLVPGLTRGALTGFLACAVAVALWLPGDSAKIAAVVGLAVAALARIAPLVAARAMAVGLALVFLAGPALLAAALARGPDLSALPPSAAHRVLIWDFTLARIEDRPWLGWGMESSRSLPGSQDTFDSATLDRFGLTSAEERNLFGQVMTRLSLHPHNAALHIRLETGLVGAMLAAALLAALALGLGIAPAVASAGLGVLASGIVTGLLSFGVWQPWWVATLMLAAVALVALRRNAPPR